MSTSRSIGQKSWYYFVPAYVLLLVTFLPLILGTETLFVRDVFNSHLPMKAHQAEALRDGYIPLVDLSRGAGQAALGNPNTSVLYPDTLLLRFFSPMWTLNVRFWVHVLLAPLFGMFLGRALGLSRGASWAMGVTYATGGFFYSQLNFHNLVAGAALTPAVVAGMLWAADGSLTWRRRGASAVFLAVVWGLALVAGDPMTCLQALGLGCAALLVKGHFRPSWCNFRGLSLSLAAGVAGSMLAAPQLFEFVRTMDASFRGLWGFSERWALVASFNPVLALEWFVPMLFGRPDLMLWGRSFYDTVEPLFLTLYPGILVLALVACSGLSLRAGPGQPNELVAARRFAWLTCLVGGFIATGSYNPGIQWLIKTSGVGLLRFPIKFWLSIAIGVSVLVALGWERTVGRQPVGEEARWSRLYAALAALLAVFVGIWAMARFRSHWIEGWVAENMSSFLPDSLPAWETQRIAQIGLVSVVLVLLLLGAAYLGQRRRALGSAMLLALHVTAQTLLIQPAMLTEDSALYLGHVPELLSAVEPGELVFHGGVNSAFGAGDSNELPDYPDPSLHWIQRRGFEELYPFIGALHGVRYDFNTSPEALDSFLTHSVSQALENVLDDAGRIRLLRALGDDLVVIDRRPAPDAEPMVRLRAKRRAFGVWAYVWEIEGAARELELVTEVIRAPHMNAALATLAKPGFDPRRQVVLPGPAGDSSGPQPHLDTSISVRARGPESIVVETESPGPAVLVWKRAYLPLYRAKIDGQSVPIEIANMTRLAVEVPAGKHQLEIHTDRVRLERAVGISILGLLGLALLPLLARRLD